VTKRTDTTTPQYDPGERFRQQIVVVIAQWIVEQAEEAA